MKSKKEQIKSIFEKIEKMETNTFLFPESWSDKIDMIDYDWSYRTYNSGNVGKNRYHNIEIYNEDEIILTIDFRREKVEVVQDLSKPTTTAKEVHFYIEAIYNELHSFKNHTEGKRDIRNKINAKIREIKKSNEDLVKLRKQLKDSDKTNK